MNMKIAIAGAAGRMGRSLVKAITLAEDMSVSGGSERVGSDLLGSDLGQLAGVAPAGVALTESLEIAGAGADVWIDFTSPAGTLRALEAFGGFGPRIVIIGTTGFTAQEEAELEGYADRLTIVKAGNFSLGVNLLTVLVEQAAERLGSDWDIEILESHHRRKVDAPSGTALMLGHAAATGRGSALEELRSAPYDGITGPREEGKIGFSVRRGGDIIGDHEVMFASDTEQLLLRHVAANRGVFADGALHAARWAVNQPPGFYSMRDVLSF